MTATRDATVAARVPLDLRQDLELIAKRTGTDLTHVIRQFLRAGADVELGRAEPPVIERLGPPTGARRRNATPTEAAAALDVAPRLNTQRRRALEHFDDHRRGLTADEVIALEQAAGRRVAVNGLARRVTDLLQAGAIRELLVGEVWVEGELVADGGAGITRQTRNGSQAQVYVITAKGRDWLDAHRAEERPR